MAQKLNYSKHAQARCASPRPQARRPRPGSGKGRYSGRGIKGQKVPFRLPQDAARLRGAARTRSTCGSASARPVFEGRDADRAAPTTRCLGQRARPRALRRARSPRGLKEAGLIRNTRIDLKILGHGDLTKKLSVSAHLFSTSAREKIEAGGRNNWLRGEPKPKRRAEEGAKKAGSQPPPEGPPRRQRSPGAEDRRAAREPSRGRARCSPGFPTPGAFHFAAASSSRR